MEILFVLIPVSLLIVLVALYAFVWSVKNGQFDDLEKEGQRILSVERNEAEYRKYEVELGAAGNDDNTDVKQQEANSLI
jgi:cbb3-type cytochrome oxidase maturation protein